MYRIMTRTVEGWVEIERSARTVNPTPPAQ